MAWGMWDGIDFAHWLFVPAVILVVLLPLAIGIACDRSAIGRDLARKGCVPRRVRWLWWRSGLPTEALDYDGWPTLTSGKVYRVRYINRDGSARVAVCMMGPDRLVFWTDEHPEPGFDRHGNPPHLPTYGQSWRG